MLRRARGFSSGSADWRDSGPARGGRRKTGPTAAPRSAARKSRRMLPARSGATPQPKAAGAAALPEGRHNRCDAPEGVGARARVTQRLGGDAPLDVRSKENVI